MSQYLDKQGKVTGQYSQVAKLGGWQTTLIFDALATYDIAILSVR